MVEKVGIYLDEGQFTTVVDALVFLAAVSRHRLAGDVEPWPELSASERVLMTEKLADIDALLTHMDIRPEGA